MSSHSPVHFPHVAGPALPYRMHRALAPLLLAAVLAAVVLGNCTLRLGPNFDRTIVDGLSKANEEAMTLFAAVARGTSAESYRTRQDKYDSLVGKLDALQLQVNARPTPPPPAVATALFTNQNAGGQPIDLSAPTAGFLVRMLDTVTKMRDTDQGHGLSARLVVGFKERFEISMSQALTYEKALER